MADAPCELQVLRCDACGSLDPGPREFCASCGDAELRTHTIQGAGRLAAWTVIRRAPTRFKQDAPYTVAVIDLHAGLRITGRLVNHGGEIVVGARVACTGIAEACYLFRIAEPQAA